MTLVLLVLTHLPSICAAFESFIQDDASYPGPRTQQNYNASNVMQ